MWRCFIIMLFLHLFTPLSTHPCMPNYAHSSSKYMNHVLGMWNGEMVSFSSASVGLSSGTFPFSISTFPSITCVSTPLAAWTNFWRFQKKETKSKSTWTDAASLLPKLLLQLFVFTLTWKTNRCATHWASEIRKILKRAYHSSVWKLKRLLTTAAAV